MLTKWASASGIKIPGETNSLEELVAFCDIGLVQLYLDPAMADPADQKPIPQEERVDAGATGAVSESSAPAQLTQDEVKPPVAISDMRVQLEEIGHEFHATPETATMVFHLLVRHTHGGETLNKDRLREAHGSSESLFTSLPANAAGDVLLEDWIRYLTDTQEGGAAWHELAAFISSDPQWARQLREAQAAGS